ncbi:putative trans-acting enoyl reductase family protein [Mycobacterium xenopi 4042]|uniref:Putative trans-acting enoyl reductase family protein n=1 Tax=Mycobacterium xenopi 4042 TaxID=1299334 RepID=X8APZ2_MYCXE|nr:putative trans-acting enoyl reductase family protein [Mycobacterium xenopi 4042]
MAGRSIDRLRTVRENLGESAQSWPLIHANASTPSTLDAMAKRTQVVVTTVGPTPATGCRWLPHVLRRDRLRRPHRGGDVCAQQH